MTRRVVTKSAIRLMAELEAADRLDEVWPRFEAWLNESPENSEAYRKAEIARCKAEVRLARSAVPPEALVEAMRRRNERLQRLLPRAAAAAAVVACIVFGGIFLLIAPAKEASYRTALGQVRKYTLEDGSTVELDTNSLIRSRFSLNHRDLFLERGRILIEVRKESWRAFQVYVNHHVVRATGTRFAVYRKSDDEFSTTVHQGAVIIKPENGSDRDAIKAAAIADNRVTISPSGIHSETRSSKDLSDDLVWRNGMLAFRNRSLKEAVGEFNRYNQRKLVIDDPTLQQRKVVGIFPANDPDRFASDLMDFHGIAHSCIGAPGSSGGEIHLGSAKARSCQQ